MPTLLPYETVLALVESGDVTAANFAPGMQQWMVVDEGYDPAEPWCHGYITKIEVLSADLDTDMVTVVELAWTEAPTPRIHTLTAKALLAAIEES